MENINIFSFFAGAGFLDLGFEKSGYDIKLVNEYLPAFMNAYQYSRKQMKLANHVNRLGNSMLEYNK